MNGNNTEKPGAMRFIMIFTLLAFANIVSVFQRFAIGVISTGLATEFSMTPAELGTLASGFLYTYAITQILSGLIVERFGVKKMVTGSLILTALAVFLFTMAATSTQLLIFRVIAGFACSFIYVPVLHAIRYWVPARWTATATGLLLSTGHVGAILASSPLLALCNALGWRRSFFLIGVFIVFLAVLAFPVLPSRRVESADRRPLSAASVFSYIRANFKNMLIPGIFIIIVWSFVAGGPRQSFQSIWAAQFYENAAGYTQQTMGILLMSISIGCIIGGPLFGWISRRLGIIATLILSTGCSVFIWFLLVPSATYLPAAAQTLLLTAMGAFGTGGFTCAFSAVRHFDIPGSEGLYIGMINSVNFFASAIYSQIFGVVIEYCGADGSFSGYWEIYAFIGVTSLIIAFLLYRINRKIVRLP